MEKLSQSLDWALIPAFLAVAAQGSLSAAARSLGCSQPTVGRQIHQIEAQLGIALFHRQPRGLVLTAEGQALLPAARAMQAGAQALALAAAGHDSALHGAVRITASKVVAHYMLPDILAQIRQAEPDIALDIVASDSTENLLFRDADIALRMRPSTQLDLVEHRLGALPMCICAARSYLARRGRPRDAADLLTHDLVGMDRSDLILRHMRDLGWREATRDWFRLRSDNQPLHFAMIRAGGGIGFAQAWMVAADPTLERLDLDIALPALTIWLAAPGAIRHTPRIARVWTLLAQGVARFVS